LPVPEINRFRLSAHYANEPHRQAGNTGYGLKCLKYKIPKLWSELPTDLEEQSSLNMFKTN